MRLPKVMMGPIRNLAGVPEDILDEDVVVNYDDDTYGDSQWGCDTCGYGKLDDTLTVAVSWPKGKWSKTYTGYFRLSEFFEDLDKASEL